MHCAHINGILYYRYNEICHYLCIITKNDFYTIKLWLNAIWINYWHFGTVIYKTSDKLKQKCIQVPNTKYMVYWSIPIYLSIYTYIWNVWNNCIIYFVSPKNGCTYTGYTYYDNNITHTPKNIKYRKKYLITRAL